MEEGGKRGRKTPQEASKGAQKGPQSSQNEPQKIQNWELKLLKKVVGRNIRKTSKSTTSRVKTVILEARKIENLPKIEQKVDAEPLQAA